MECPNCLKKMELVDECYGLIEEKCSVPLDVYYCEECGREEYTNKNKRYVKYKGNREYYVVTMDEIAAYTGGEHNVQ